jgi:hypothetical protein
MKTAVEWLVYVVQSNIAPNYIPKEIVEQAKEMEKEQIKNAWLNSLTKGDFNSADEYYNETYKQQSVTDDTL